MAKAQTTSENPQGEVSQQDTPVLPMQYDVRIHSTTAFFLERRNAVRPITILKTIGPKKKEKIDTTSGLTVVGSKATTSRSLSRQRIARTKFSKMEYINGPVRITKMFLQYKARINPKVITKRLTMPLQRDRATAYNSGVFINAFSNIWLWQDQILKLFLKMMFKQFGML